ncbi:class I SAM-dependent methyltransferase [Lacihabitans sp. LS3-19]|nr:class I SAM-dependent methyltransferase [Lacihabitans sp. LS3-19]
MKEFWNERYNETEYAYGENPNVYVEEKLKQFNKGKILFPCEGEGRNATYAAKNGWVVFACDISEEGKIKAEKLAQKYDTNFDYQVCDILDYQAEENSFDAIVLVFAHFPESIRKKVHHKLLSLLKPGGVIILEGFNKKQLGNPSGGPKVLEMLFSKEMLLEDFEECEVLELVEKPTILSEGNYHNGTAEIISGIFLKK